MNKAALKILDEAIRSVSPYTTVRDGVKKISENGDKFYCLAIGKAACSMARGCVDELGQKLVKGIAITKYGCEESLDDRIEVCSAGHPVLDENSIVATKKAIDFASTLTEKDKLIFLISGGGSAVFEFPRVSLSSLQTVTQTVLRSGAPIEVMNDIRKRLSFVKGGGFLSFCKAQITCLILSDVLGDDVSSIASGPCFCSLMSDEKLRENLKKYNLDFDKEILDILFDSNREKLSRNVDYMLVGNVDKLCENAALQCEKFGYKTQIVDKRIEGEASVWAKKIVERAFSCQSGTALIYGGETTVTVRGTGLGGRNQEMALTAAKYLDNVDKNITFLSAGSDGTDGPTDAAGGIVDKCSADCLRQKGLDIDSFLDNNDSYHALNECGGLIKTGATGTNVNDVVIVLID